jgi:hypothetical protein
MIRMRYLEDRSRRYVLIRNGSFRMNLLAEEQGRPVNQAEIDRYRASGCDISDVGFIGEYPVVQIQQEPRA